MKQIAVDRFGQVIANGRKRTLRASRNVPFLKQTGVFGSKSDILGRFICLKSFHDRLKRGIDTLKLLKTSFLLDLMPVFDLFVRRLHRNFTSYGSLACVFVQMLSEDRFQSSGVPRPTLYLKCHNSGQSAPGLLSFQRTWVRAGVASMSEEYKATLRAADTESAASARPAFSPLRAGGHSARSCPLPRARPASAPSPGPRPGPAGRRQMSGGSHAARSPLRRPALPAS
jgi:hypothetical protein